MSFLLTENFLLFLGAAVLLAILPGPGLAYVVARTVAGGRAEGMASTAGTALGGMVHVVAAALGLSLLVAESAQAFTVLKYLGAAYLVYLGIRTLLSGSKKSETGMEVLAKATGTRRAFREGIVVEALNVKTALFFLAFIPQFVVPSAAPVALQFVVLGSICVALNTAVDVLAVLGAHAALRSGAARQGRAWLLNTLAGGSMLGLGVYLALSSTRER